MCPGPRRPSFLQAGSLLGGTWASGGLALVPACSRGQCTGCSYPRPQFRICYRKQKGGKEGGNRPQDGQLEMLLQVKALTLRTCLQVIRSPHGTPPSSSAPSRHEAATVDRTCACHWRCDGSPGLHGSQTDRSLGTLLPSSSRDVWTPLPASHADSVPNRRNASSPPVTAPCVFQNSVCLLF